MELAELVSDVEDITDPASMEKLLMYQDQLQAEDDDFMELLVDKVKDEVTSWPQPWYQSTGGLTRPLDLHGGDGSETFRTDSFDKEETKILAKNWKKFRKMFDMPDKPDCFARWRNKTKCRNPRRADVEKARQFVVAFLAKGLERNLYQVYLYFVAQYAAPVRGKFSDVEEKIMSIYFYHKPSKAVPCLAIILGREARGISKKLHYKTHGKPEKKRLKWNLIMATKLVQSLMEHTGLPLNKMKGAKFQISDWLKVQEDMDQSYVYLQRFWYTFLHVQLFVKYDVKLKRLRKKILKRLKSKYQVWTDIRWKDLLQKFPDGFTHNFLYRTVQPIVNKYPGNYRMDPLKDVANYGLDKLKNTKKYSEQRLKTLKLNEDGSLEIVKYEEEMP